MVSMTVRLNFEIEQANNLIFNLAHAQEAGPHHFTPIETITSLIAYTKQKFELHFLTRHNVYCWS